MGGGSSTVLLLTERTTQMTTIKKPRRMARPASDIDAAKVSAPANMTPAQKRPTKQDLVLTLLQGEGGVPLGAITQATGWQPHTTRAMLTGLRKKGHAVMRSRVDGETRYAVAAVASQ